MNNEEHQMLEKANEIKMKRLLFFFIALIPMLYVSAQGIKTKATYQYGYIECLDKNGDVVDEFDCEGIILFADAGKQEWISITIGDEETYTGRVHSKKQESINSETTMTVYLVIQEFNEHKVPLQVFEVYDLTKSSNIPNYFMVSICNATTGEVIQSQSFYKISRIR